MKISNPPKQLYYKGVLPAFDKSWIAIVGTRRPSPFGEAICKALIHSLKNTDAVVVSGLAQGIDSFCHEAALAEGLPTIAVVAQGLGIPFGGSREILARKIIEARGGVISEYEESIPSQKFTYPARNRIIAGLSKSTTVVESKLKGGALITAGFAIVSNRKLLCIPGSILSETSQGTNRLIKTKQAEAIWNAEDFPDLAGAKKSGDLTKSSAAKTGIKLSPKAESVFNANAGFTPTLSEILESSGFAIAELLAILTELEIAGLVQSKEGDAFHFSPLE